jgi:single-strand DNA-binding protein
MTDINKVTIIGRLTRDAELKYTNGGTAICEFALAVNNAKKKGEEWVDEPSFFDVTVFGRQGEAIQQYMVKGKQVGVVGRLEQQRWQNQEGQNRSKVVIIAETVQLLRSKGEDTGNSPQSTGQRTSASRPSTPAPSAGDDFPDDIPF